MNILDAITGARDGAAVQQLAAQGPGRHDRGRCDRTIHMVHGRIVSDSAVYQLR